MGKLKIEYMNVNDLIPYINNPRMNDGAVDKVASSIKNFGFKNPIIIDKDNEIVAGHNRILAARN
jgi:site-specific DNA-methyltransferase (adenine-specific)